MKTAGEIIDDLIRREGPTFTNRPADRGGPTKYGVTQKTLAGAWKRAVTLEEVAALTEDAARQVYELEFIVRPGYGPIVSDELRAFVVDCAVQHGPATASEWLQASIAVTIDGQVGPKTIAAVNSAPLRTVYALILSARMAYYGKIVSHDPVLAKARAAGFNLQAENAYGWANRLGEFARQTAVL